PFSELPKMLNPAKGFVATANEMNLPDSWNWSGWPVGFEWSEHSRTGRIHEVLRAQQRHTLEDSLALQTDVLSIPARRLADLLHRLAADGDTALGRDLLLRWDRRLAADSPAAELHEVC